MITCIHMHTHAYMHTCYMHTHAHTCLRAHMLHAYTCLRAHTYTTCTFIIHNTQTHTHIHTTVVERPNPDQYVFMKTVERTAQVVLDPE